MQASKPLPAAFCARLDIAVQVHRHAAYPVWFQATSPFRSRNGIQSTRIRTESICLPILVLELEVQVLSTLLVPCRSASVGKGLILPFLNSSWKLLPERLSEWAYSDANPAWYCTCFRPSLNSWLWQARASLLDKHGFSRRQKACNMDTLHVMQTIALMAVSICLQTSSIWNLTVQDGSASSGRQSTACRVSWKMCHARWLISVACPCSNTTVTAPESVRRNPRRATSRATSRATTIVPISPSHTATSTGATRHGKVGLSVMSQHQMVVRPKMLFFWREIWWMLLSVSRMPEPCPCFSQSQRADWVRLPLLLPWWQ